MLRKIIELTFLTLVFLAGVNACVHMDSYEQVMNLPKYGENKLGDNPDYQPYPPIIRLRDDKGFFCSAFVIDDNYAVTAAHCLTGSWGELTTKAIHIHDVYDNDTTIKAQAVGINKRMDYGLVKGDFQYFKRYPILTHPSFLYKPQILTACGFPFNQKKMVCVPILAQHTSGFQVAAEGYLYPGMSGGPVLTREGIAVGTNSAAGEGSILFAPLVGILSTFGIE